MAGNFNKVILLGNLTRDPELRHTSGNQAVASIGLAVNRRWRSPDGEQREETTFVDCEAWGKTAELMCQYLSKGRPVFIEGRLKLDQWEKEGQKFSKLRVVVENFQFVDSGQGRGGGGGGGEGEGGSSRPYSRGSGGGGARPPSAPVGPGTDGGSPIGEDDIPF
ncbi:MAG: single-stranded DNA-binding protein [Phycisphaeraceae bacterium]|nr:single-stranded DNA-binding protein [Phycisphaerae bacterium]MBX3391531.1 single-stranded DNA-binding protein [Phycisphaeraceae bacterium]